MADTQQNQPEKKIARSPDFKYLPCDTINMALGDNGVKLILGVDEVDGSTLELVGVHLTHRTANFLRAVLEQGLDHYQKETGKSLEEPDFSDSRVGS